MYFGSTGKTEAGLTTKVVLDLIDPGPELKIGAGYKPCLDNYYTSKALFDKSWEKKVMACGAMRRNRKGDPKQLDGTVKKSYRGDFRWVRDGNCTYYERMTTARWRSCLPFTQLLLALSVSEVFRANDRRSHVHP